MRDRCAHRDASPSASSAFESESVAYLKMIAEMEFQSRDARSREAHAAEHAEGARATDEALGIPRRAILRALLCRGSLS